VIQVGIIGAGYWGPNLIRNFMRIPGVKVEAVADRLSGRRNFIKSEFPDLHLTDSDDWVINNKDIDVIVIATPVSSHFDLGKKALLAGKHIFIEKPFVNSFLKAEQLIEIGERKSLKIGVGHIFTFHPAIEYVHDFIDKTNEFKTNYLISNRANLRPPKTHHDVIWDLAVHDFSIVNYLFEEFPLSVFTVSCDCSCKGLNDMAVIILRYSGNRKAIIHVNWHTPRKIRRFELYGNKWSIFFDDMVDEKIEIFDEGIDNRVGADENVSNKFEYRPGIVLKPDIPSAEPLLQECQAFIDHIREGVPYRNDGIQGLWAVKMCELAIKSTNTGEEIAF
jgi:predicted dehydrogenase